MALIVQKYGGTSVGDIERIQGVAARVVKARQAGHDVVVVVSAMSIPMMHMVKHVYWVSKLSAYATPWQKVAYR